MSLQHHAAAAEEGKGAAGGGTLEIWGWWWWWRVQRTWLGRPLRPLPLPARGRDHSRFLACQSCRPLQAGGRVYGGVFLAEGRPVLLCTREDASLPPRHSLEFFFFFFFGRACVCLSAWQCCPEQSAFSELHGGEAGEPLQICRSLCVTDCLVCARFEPSGRLSTLHPLTNSRGGGFVSSLAP